MKSNFRSSIRLVFALLVYFVTDQSFSQWVRVQEIPAAEMYSLTVDGDNIYLGGANRIYISRNRGVSWSRSDSLVGYGIDAIVSHDGNLFAGVGGRGIYRSTNGSASWHIFNDGLVGLGSNSISTFLKHNNALYLGTNGAGTFRLGGQWEPFGGLPLSVAGTVYSMFKQHDTLIAGAGANGTLFVLRPGSAQWEDHPFGDPRGEPLGATSFASHNGWVFTGTHQGVYRSKSATAAWQYAGSGIVGFSQAIFMVSSGDSIFAIQGKAGSTVLYVSTNDGEQWLNRGSLAGFTTGAAIVNSRLYISNQFGLWYRELSTTTVEDPVESPKSITLYQNFPNPFNPATTIGFAIRGAGLTTLKVYNTLGQEVATLVNEELKAGKHQKEFDARGLASGIYFYRLRSGVFSETRKLVLLR